MNESYNMGSFVTDLQLSLVLSRFIHVTAYISTLFFDD